MFQKVKQWHSVIRAQKPARYIFYIILFVNILLALFAAVLNHLFYSGNGNNISFWEHLYNAVLLILNTGSINELLNQSQTWKPYEVFSAIIYISLIVLTMISFTGALIGFLTNKISRFIERSSAGVHKLRLTQHTVILNWNNRAAEIINDMLFKRQRERIVILVQDDKENVETEIHNRLKDTIRHENQQLRDRYREEPLLRKQQLYWKNKLRNKLVVIVRQGDIYSAQRLTDIAVGQAKSIMILEQAKKHVRPGTCCSTIKLLMQVAEITACAASRNHQKIIVEVNNKWTMDLVQQIIAQKEKQEKVKIIPVEVNDMLGQILAQVFIMPELNLVYNELFSYRGAEFFTTPTTETNECRFVQTYLRNHMHALPLTVTHNTAYYMARLRKDIDLLSKAPSKSYAVELRTEYRMDKKSVIILGHNAKYKALLDGLYAFDQEWEGSQKLPVLDIVVIDDAKGLEQYNGSINNPLISRFVEADISDKDKICRTVDEFINNTDSHVSILILSDDIIDCDDADRSVFTHLIYVQSTINQKVKSDPSFDRNRIDVVVELCNPKNADIIASYNVNYVIISNRYISRLFNHLSEKEALYDFLVDVLTYDDVNGCVGSSKEIYIKQVSSYFKKLPEPSTARQLILAVYDASPKDNKAVVLGVMTANKELQLFTGNQCSRMVELQPNDSLVLFSNH